MSWYCVEISESCILGGRYHRLCRQFQHAFIAAGAPPEMAMLAERSTLEDTRRVYFSPGSAEFVEELIESYGGSRAERPEREDVILVYGVPGITERLFAEEPVREQEMEVEEPEHEGVAIYPLVSMRQAASNG
jgi:hypothetical protein